MANGSPCLTFLQLLNLFVGERRPVPLEFPLQSESELRVLVSAGVVFAVAVTHGVVDALTAILIERSRVGEIWKEMSTGFIVENSICKIYDGKLCHIITVNFSFFCNDDINLKRKGSF